MLLGGPPNPFERQIKLAADVGVDFVSFPVSLPWPPPGKPVDFSASDAECRQVLDANPKALLLPRIGMEPPEWWLREHPDDVMVWDTPGQPGGFVVASPEYRRDAAERLAALVRHLEEKFGPSMAGYHPCGQNTGEWFYQETWGPALNGYSQGSLRAWRAWLGRRYADDAALQAAWRDPAGHARDGRRALARRPPRRARRHAPRSGGRAAADRLRRVPAGDDGRLRVPARPGRREKPSRGRKLVVFFYGYVFEFGPIRNGSGDLRPLRPAARARLPRHRRALLADLLLRPRAGPERAGDDRRRERRPGRQDVALRGRHADLPGHGPVPRARSTRVDTLEDTNRELLRNTAQCALRNFGTWWMDLGATGWFNDPRMWAEMARLKALDEPLLEHPRPFRPEVAAVIDEPSMIRVAAGGDVVTRPGVYEVRRPLGRMGAPYGQYLLDDVTAGRVEAKMYVLLTAWRLTPDQRRAAPRRDPRQPPRLVLRPRLPRRGPNLAGRDVRS